MKKSKSIQIIKQQGIAEFIKYKKIKIYTKYEKKFNINIFTPYLLKFCKPFVRGILKRTCNYPKLF